ncbi:cell filamentation protein Fic, partial [bacterium]|nr:cell filamentation protein Fic [bacterium]
MRYATIDEIAVSWGISTRQVRSYCASGRVAGAKFEHGAWMIPEGAEKPSRKVRAKQAKFRSVLAVLDAERKSKLSGGIYHQLQIDFTYNSNHMEGSRLTHDQTRWIFETKTIGKINADISVDDIVETANHFRAVDTVIASAKSALTETYVKRLHAILKSGTADSCKDWFSVGEYKRLENTVGGMDTTPPEKV